MNKFFEILGDIFDTKASRDRRVDELVNLIKANAISVTTARYSDYIVPQKHLWETTITETTPRPFYRAARPAKRWK